MRRFDLLEPRSIGETCQILGEREDVKLVAGGTALLILIKQGLFVPRTLVNLQKVTDASEITYDAEKGLRIGALASIYDVETSPHVVQHYPVLARACHVVANIRIRNLATIGGNLSHADYQSDPPAALVALDARVELTSVGGIREVPIAEFLRGSYETLLEPQEVLFGCAASSPASEPAGDLPEVYHPFLGGPAVRRSDGHGPHARSPVRGGAARGRRGFTGSRPGLSG